VTGGSGPSLALAAAALAASVAALYAPALGFEFLAYDDTVYVTRNPHLAGGLTAAGVRFAFANVHAGNWHPLTWLSHGLDVELFGLAPAGHHATNVALHALNAVLLFFALLALTGRRGRSFAVAALWALHPLQLESVAWVAERKNLLSTSFGLLALQAYAGHARRGGAAGLAAVTALFAASLMAKAMLVTLPCLLLLLDVWPLARPTSARRLVLEKLPLFALAAGVSALVFLAQARAGALEPAAHLPLLARLAYLPIAYAGYLARVLWPLDLAVLYPHPLLAEGATLGSARVALALGVLLALSALAFWRFRRGQPAVWIGWLWFLGTLVPVSGIVQVGWQGLADRYAYVPLIGLLVALVWTAADALSHLRPEPRRVLAGTAVTALACALLALAARAQLGHWRSSRALFERAIAVTGPNPVMHNELGVVLAAEKRYEPAREHFERALRLAPRWSAPYQNLGSLLRTVGRPAEALPYLEESVELSPSRIPARVALANVLLDLGRTGDAHAQLERALALDPRDAHALLLRLRFEQLEAATH
jgi:tetratricopeptide (TPR) repeat protein